MKTHINKTVISVKPEILLEEDGHYFICLSPVDTKDKRDFHMEVGDPEATHIYFAMNHQVFEKSHHDIHDVYIETLKTYNIQILSVVITEREGLLWNATLNVTNLDTKESTYIECKPSDAMVISLKLNLDLYIYEDVLDAFIKDNAKTQPKEKNKLNQQNNLDRMYKMLNDYIEHEEYEKAAELTKLIQNVKDKKD